MLLLLCLYGALFTSCVLSLCANRTIAGAETTISFSPLDTSHAPSKADITVVTWKDSCASGPTPHVDIRQVTQVGKEYSLQAFFDRAGWYSVCYQWGREWHIAIKDYEVSGANSYEVDNPEGTLPDAPVDIIFMGINLDLKTQDSSSLIPVGYGTCRETLTSTPTNTITSAHTITASRLYTETPTTTSPHTQTPDVTRSATVTHMPTNTQTTSVSITLATTTTQTHTPIQTAVLTATPTIVPTYTPSSSSSPTETTTLSPKVTVTFTRTNTITVSQSMSRTSTDSTTPTPTQTFSQTLVPTATLTPTVTNTVTGRVTPTSTLSLSLTRTRTETNTGTTMPTASPSLTLSASDSGTTTVSHSHSKTYTNSVTGTHSPEPTRTKSWTSTITTSYSNTKIYTLSVIPTTTNTASISPTFVNTTHAAVKALSIALFTNNVQTVLKSSGTATPSITPTSVPTLTPTFTGSPSPDGTTTLSHTSSHTSSTSLSHTSSHTPTHSTVPTTTTTMTWSVSRTQSITGTTIPTNTRSVTFTLTSTPTPTRSQTITPTTTFTTLPTTTPTPLPTSTKTTSLTPTSTLVPTSSTSVTPSPTSVPTHSRTPTISLSRTITYTRTLTASKTRTATHTLTPTPTRELPTTVDRYVSGIPPGIYRVCYKSCDGDWLQVGALLASKIARVIVNTDAKDTSYLNAATSVNMHATVAPLVDYRMEVIQFSWKLVPQDTQLQPLGRLSQYLLIPPFSFKSPIVNVEVTAHVKVYYNGEEAWEVDVVHKFALRINLGPVCGQTGVQIPDKAFSTDTCGCLIKVIERTLRGTIVSEDPNAEAISGETELQLITNNALPSIPNGNPLRYSWDYRVPGEDLSTPLLFWTTQRITYIKLPIFTENTTLQFVHRVKDKTQLNNVVCLSRWVPIQAAPDALILDQVIKLKTRGVSYNAMPMLTTLACDPIWRTNENVTNLAMDALSITFRSSVTRTDSTLRLVLKWSSLLQCHINSTNINTLVQATEFLRKLSDYMAEPLANYDLTLSVMKTYLTVLTTLTYKIMDDIASSTRDQRILLLKQLYHNTVQFTTVLARENPTTLMTLSSDDNCLQISTFTGTLEQHKAIWQDVRFSKLVDYDEEYTLFVFKKIEWASTCNPFRYSNRVLGGAVQYVIELLRVPEKPESRPLLLNSASSWSVAVPVVDSDLLNDNETACFQMKDYPQHKEIDWRDIKELDDFYYLGFSRVLESRATPGACAPSAFGGLFLRIVPIAVPMDEVRLPPTVVGAVSTPSLPIGVGKRLLFDDDSASAWVTLGVTVLPVVVLLLLICGSWIAMKIYKRVQRGLMPWQQQSYMKKYMPPGMDDDFKIHAPYYPVPKDMLDREAIQNHGKLYEYDDEESEVITRDEFSSSDTEDPPKPDDSSSTTSRPPATRLAPKPRHMDIEGGTACSTSPTGGSTQPISNPSASPAEFFTTASGTPMPSATAPAQGVLRVPSLYPSTPTAGNTSSPETSPAVQPQQPSRVERTNNLLTDNHPKPDTPVSVHHPSSTPCSPEENVITYHSMVLKESPNLDRVVHPGYALASSTIVLRPEAHPAVPARCGWVWGDSTVSAAEIDVLLPQSDRSYNNNTDPKYTFFI